MIWRGVVARPGVAAPRGLLSSGLPNDEIGGVPVGMVVLTGSEDSTLTVASLRSITGVFVAADNTDGTFVVN